MLFLSDNSLPVDIFERYFILLSAVFFICLITWYLFGRDNPKKIIIPEFSAPDNLTPAEIRYIYNKKYDFKCLSVLLVNAAIKGFVKIEKVDKKIQIVKTSKYSGNLTEEANNIIGDAKAGEIIVLNYEKNQN